MRTQKHKSLYNIEHRPIYDVLHHQQKDQLQGRIQEFWKGGGEAQPEMFERWGVAVKRKALSQSVYRKKVFCRYRGGGAACAPPPLNRPLGSTQQVAGTSPNGLDGCKLTKSEFLLNITNLMRYRDIITKRTKAYLSNLHTENCRNDCVFKNTIKSVSQSGSY